MNESFLKLIEYSIKTHWQLPALTDYNGTTLTYRDAARRIEKLRIIFEQSGIQKGDRVALCGRNSANWGVAFFAILVHGGVAVPILNEFRPETIHHIINHSGAKLLFVSDSVWESLQHDNMPALEGVFRISDFDILMARNQQVTDTRERLNELYGKRYPRHFRMEEVDYREESPEELAMINYTSGTTSSPKGVMLTYRSLWSNLRSAIDRMGYNPGERLVSILTMAHMYGLAFELIYPFASGTHVYFISKTPSPKIISEVFREVRPHLIVAVPLIIEKIIRSRVLPHLQRFHIRLFMTIPALNRRIRETIKQKIMDAFGGRFKLLAVGGAALNHEVEAFLASVQFPYTVGYGMTECGPLLTYDDWRTFRVGSCGKAVDRMTLRIQSADELNTVGEILAKGDNVMIGYYNNPEATRQAIDEEGWLHTGDLGVFDKEHYLFIKGRIKNMILGPSGQNIYPEEIEDKLNVMPYVVESLIVEHLGKLVALVFPDAEAVQAAKLTRELLQKAMDENKKLLNQQLPAYSQVTKIYIQENEFEKTPKRSIKRYLYQEPK